ncbi:hypothetical protein P389DRAFT_147822 [Cystobasidium minutum MCA 4210]|uniref:uncharacterized protein n=1 Tax=Cystobasidium minutum MCA 4210 TaxID=1397322 RepID=UPI0034CE6CFE|eukprot:jgi/Rhomi1/147822/e_gw1.9.263.1
MNAKFSQNGRPGACGNKRSDNDYIVALHPSLYNNGARCGQKISLTNKATGKTLTAEVQDLCPSCGGNTPGPQIDLSKKLFDDLSNGADGIFQVTYGFR